MCSYSGEGKTPSYSQINMVEQNESTASRVFFCVLFD